MALLKTTDKKEFDEKVTKSDKVVLVDFWAEWCGPCRAMAPILEDASKELDGEVDIVKVNIEESNENNALASEHGVRSIPNMVIFKGGKEVGRIIGLTQKVPLVTKLKSFVTA